MRSCGGIRKKAVNSPSSGWIFCMRIPCRLRQRFCMGRSTGSRPGRLCDASNQDFMDLLGCSETTVRNLLKALEEEGQIRVVTQPRREGSGGTERRIFCGRKLAPPETQKVPAKNCGYPRGGYPQKFAGGTRRNLRVHI